MGLQPGLFSTGIVLRLEIRPCLPTQLIAEPPAGEVSGRLSFIGSPSPPQTPEGASDSKAAVVRLHPGGAACNPGVQSHPPCHPAAARAPSLPPPCRVPRSTRGRPRVRDSRALSHDSTALSATGLPAPYLADSLAHCAGASLARPD